MKQAKDTAASSDRRSFLKLAGIGAAAGGAAAVGQPIAAEAAPTASQGDYRETEHVKRYYELARS